MPQFRSCWRHIVWGNVDRRPSLIELNVNYLQKYPIPFLICPFPEIIKLHKSAELCNVTPSPCLGWKIQISTSLSSGLTLGSRCSLPVVHLLYSFLKLAHDLQNKFLQAIILHVFVIEFTFIRITTRLFLPTSFQFKKFALFLVHLWCWVVLGGETQPRVTNKRLPWYNCAGCFVLLRRHPGLYRVAHGQKLIRNHGSAIWTAS